MATVSSFSNLPTCYTGRLDERVGENLSGVVYLWTETRNNVEYPCYVGQTINTIFERLKGHLINDVAYLFQHKLRNRPKSFQCYILVSGVVDIADLNRLEAFYIKEYNTFHDGNPNGYNLTLGGDNTLLSEATKKKMSLSHVGRSPANKGKSPTEETKQKISEAVRGEKNGFFGHKHSDTTKSSISLSLSGERHPNYGKKRPATTRLKISEANRKRVYSPETLKKMSQANLGKTLSEETRRKMSVSHKKRNAELRCKSQNTLG